MPLATVGLDISELFISSSIREHYDEKSSIRILGDDTRNILPMLSGAQGWGNSALNSFRADELVNVSPDQHQFWELYLNYIADFIGEKKIVDNDDISIVAATSNLPQYLLRCSNIQCIDPCDSLLAFKLLSEAINPPFIIQTIYVGDKYTTYNSYEFNSSNIISPSVPQSIDIGLLNLYQHYYDSFQRNTLSSTVLEQSLKFSDSFLEAGKHLRKHNSSLPSELYRPSTTTIYLPRSDEWKRWSNTSKLQQWLSKLIEETGIKYSSYDLPIYSIVGGIGCLWPINDLLNIKQKSSATSYLYSTLGASCWNEFMSEYQYYKSNTSVNAKSTRLERTSEEYQPNIDLDVKPPWKR